VESAFVRVYEEDAVTYAAYPLGFVIMKATDGTSGVPENFKKNWSGSRTIDIVRGAYHWFYPTLPAAAQAEHYAKTVGKPETGDLPPILDLEWWDPRDDYAEVHAWLRIPANRKTYIENAKEYIKHVKALLKQDTVIIYTGPGFWAELGNPHDFDEYPLWLADYVKGVRRKAHLPVGWTNWYMWQYKGYADTTDKDQFIPSIDSKTGCDLNVFAGSLDELRASVGLVD
jgi:lysozyme